MKRLKTLKAMRKAAEGRRAHSLSGGPRGAGMLSPDIARCAEPFLLPCSLCVYGCVAQP